MCVYICTDIYACMYIYVYACTYIYICINTFIERAFISRSWVLEPVSQMQCRSWWSEYQSLLDCRFLHLGIPMVSEVDLPNLPSLFHSQFQGRQICGWENTAFSMWFVLEQQGNSCQNIYLACWVVLGFASWLIGSHTCWDIISWRLVTAVLISWGAMCMLYNSIYLNKIF